MMYYKLPGDAVAQGYNQRPHCPCSLCREQVYYSPSKNFTGTEEEFYEEGHACLYIESRNGWWSFHLSQKALKAAGLLDDNHDRSTGPSPRFTPWNK